MSGERVFTPDQQFCGLGILTYLSDLLTESPRESFSRDEVLVLLDCVRSDGDLFDPDVVIAYEKATADVEG